MTKVSITRFNRTRSGYRQHDVHSLPHGPDCADILNGTIGYLATPGSKEPEAWSFCRFKSGSMSGDTWIAGTAILIEYHQTSDPLARYHEITQAADRLFYAYYVVETATRKGEPTFTLAFPLSEEVDEKCYVRIVSVLATQLKLFNSTSGILSHTHLVHVHPDSAVEYRAGLVLNPEFLIRTTKSEAQNFDPQRFQRANLAARAQLDKPVCTAAADSLFVGL